MDLSSTLLLALGMSMDAFTASIGKGASLPKPRLRDALRIGLIFGIVETLTPLIGWSLGLLANQLVLAWNHWVAFILLLFLGSRMIYVGLSTEQDENRANKPHNPFWLLVVTAIATSLDAMAVGVGLAFLQVDIIKTSLVIGTTTLVMSTLGIMTGRFIGPVLGKRAEILGGLVLIAIGCEILYSHYLV